MNIELEGAKMRTKYLNVIFKLLKRKKETKGKRFFQRKISFLMPDK